MSIKTRHYVIRLWQEDIYGKAWYMDQQISIEHGYAPTTIEDVICHYEATDKYTLVELVRELS